MIWMTLEWSNWFPGVNVDTFSVNPRLVNILVIEKKEIDFFFQLLNPKLLTNETNKYTKSKIAQHNCFWNEDLYCLSNSDGNYFRPKSGHVFLEGQFVLLCGDHRIDYKRQARHNEAIFSYLYITQNPACGHPGHDKLAHVQPFIEQIS